MPIEIKNDLLRDDIDIGELECFLLHHFSGASQSKKRTITYGGQLTVLYSANGRAINSITWPDDGCPNLLKHLIAKAEEILYCEPILEINGHPIFFHKPVEKFLRIGNDFQIIPLPADSARPEVAYAAHPALLEFSYNKSPVMTVNGYRRDRRFKELLLLINLLIRHHWFELENSGTHGWSIIGHGEEIESKWLQRSYFPAGEWESKDEIGFSVDKKWGEIGRMEATKYYSEFAGIRIGEELIFPDTFELNYDQFQKLDAENKRKFLRAIFWYYCSHRIFHDSKSLAFSVLVFAIEALVPLAELGQECEKCGIPKKESINKRFADFVTYHCAGLPRKQITDFTAMRSKYVHGSSLMIDDADSGGFRFNAASNLERQHYSQLQQVCNVVLINWLHATAASQR